MSIASKINPMLVFHTREKERLEALRDKWINVFLGRSSAYAEAAYAHEAALIHLNRLATSIQEAS